MGFSFFFSSPNRCVCFVALAVLVAVVVVLVPVPARAQLVINEIYYDHPGSDDGHEFIELFNHSSQPVVVADCVVEFHNGAGEGFSEIWRGTGIGIINPGAVFSIGGRYVVPVPDAALESGLQNGPDAIRVIVSGIVTDLAGYGGLDDPLYAETRGAAPVPAGMSTGRWPDGRDSGDNRTDFVALVPSPGRYNRPRVDAALVTSPSTPLAAVRRHSTDEPLEVRIENRGLSDIPSGAVCVSARDSSSTGVSHVGSVWNREVIGPGMVENVVVKVSLKEGYQWITTTLDYEGDERSHNNTLVFVRRVGVIALVLSEILSDPPPGAPQFVELYNAGTVPQDIAGFTMRDRTHAPSLITRSSRIVVPGAYVVITPDTIALAMTYGPLPPGSVLAFDGSWPTLNRTGSPVADSVVVLDAYGLLVEAVAIPPVPASVAGRSLERVDLFVSDGDAVWVASADPARATPGRAGQGVLTHAAALGTVDVSPNPFTPSQGDHLLVAITVVPGITRSVVTAWDSRGLVVATLGSSTVFPAVLAWDGVDRSGRILMPGLYVIAVEYYASNGARVGVDRVVVGCAASTY
ncbi:MAG: lamin tail domain-containing protein [Candidatus Krumholzibacteriota bacterium]|nr:lamin tail domain-containing protein [Candidatus Krumholzibacteriota bacterium]